MARKAHWSIYLIGCKPDNGLFKVGITAQPLRRLRDLQNGVPFHLTILWRRAVSPYHYRALSIERRLHALLAPQRTRGEWYSGLTPDSIAVTVAALLIRPDPVRLVNRGRNQQTQNPVETGNTNNHSRDQHKGQNL